MTPVMPAAIPLAVSATAALNPGPPVTVSVDTAGVPGHPSTEVPFDANWNDGGSTVRLGAAVLETPPLDAVMVSG